MFLVIDVSDLIFLYILFVVKLSYIRSGRLCNNSLVLDSFFFFFSRNYPATLCIILSLKVA